MARVKIDADEYYPFYRLDSESGVDVTIAGQTLERWNRVMAEFRVVQEEMEGVHERAVASLPPRPKQVKPVKKEEPLLAVEYVCLDDECTFSSLSMQEAQEHEDEAPNIHPVVMRTKVVD